MREGGVYCIDYDELYREVDGVGVLYTGAVRAARRRTIIDGGVMDGLAAKARTMFNV